MAKPIIRISQPGGAGTGTPGECLTVQAGFSLEFEDTEAANAGASYEWSVLTRPVDSTFELADEDTATPAGPDPDVPGTVWIMCQATIDGVTLHSVLGFAVNTPNLGQRIPGFGEGREWNEGGNEQGWAAALASFMLAADEGGGGGKVSEDDTAPGFLEDKIIAGSNIAIEVLDEGGNEQLEISCSISEWWETRPSYLGAASVYDDEFDADSSASYSTDGTVGSNAPTTGITVTSGDVRRAYGNGSHLLQPVDNTVFQEYSTFANPTNCWIWMRCVPLGRPGRYQLGVGSGTWYGWGVYLGQHATNFTDDFVALLVGAIPSGGNHFSALGTRRSGGSSAAFEGVLDNVNYGMLCPWTQLWLQKTGTVYTFYVGRDVGTWASLGATTGYNYPGGQNLQYLRRRYHSVDSTQPTAVFDTSFIRYGATTLPSRLPGPWVRN